MSKHLDAVLRDAVDQGLLDAAHAGFEDKNRPWPVIVMTAVCAWLSAIPLGALVAFVFMSGHKNTGTLFLLGVSILAGAIAMLRYAGKSLFVEQLAIPGLIIGTGFLAFWFSLLDMATNNSSLVFAITAALAFGMAFLLPQHWLRVLLGASSASLLATSLSGLPGFIGELYISDAESWHCLALLWLVAQPALMRLQQQHAHAHVAAVLETLFTGIGAITLLALAFYSGDTFLLSASLADELSGYADAYPPGSWHSVISAVFAIGAGLWMARRWPVLRTAWFAALTATAVLLCWFAVSMGAVLLMLAFSITGGRRNMAILAGGVALWMTGAFYYNLYWPLVHKALLLIGCGCAIGAIARFILPTALLAPAAQPQVEPQVQPAPALDARWKRCAIASTGMLALVVVNAAIWNKEALIRTGQPVFVELAPVDPRSLMQGDYMALDYVFPEKLDAPLDGRAKLVARRAPNGIVSLLGLHKGQPLAKDEILIEVIEKHERPLIVTDAWYFKEGEAERWAAARYGEFRVDASGKALLVGLRGPKLEKL
ncbi:GDYXXLXY domain-containing protein [Massilia sp. IC2-278]|uniref:GDYXXLXY domain-containing protein n=1 Tax=Massilia sp. IC2-278 TaxID=2887200 RepID=UPI001E3DF7F9|nr:GDYXXLXY domain-containing protein [Massilia sp. IC2-278]MCC2963483.1 GDYXXLXY domain-containing protein [Massilia sp. IC2-278]